MEFWNAVVDELTFENLFSGLEDLAPLIVMAIMLSIGVMAIRTMVIGIITPQDPRDTTAYWQNKAERRDDGD